MTQYDQWQPVETAPAYKDVLVMEPSGQMWVAWMHPRVSSRTAEVWRAKSSSKIIKPSRWMNLPAPDEEPS